VFDGLAIYNQLKAHPARVVVDVDGVAASIASIIAMAGDEIRMAGNAMMMIHNPHGMAVGDSTEMMRTAALLDQVKGNLTGTYAARTGNKRDQLEAWMNDETWLTAEAAVQHGFADVVTQEQLVAASFKMLENFRNLPDALRRQQQDEAVRPIRAIAAARIAQQAERIRARA